MVNNSDVDVQYKLPVHDNVVNEAFFGNVLNNGRLLSNNKIGTWSQAKAAAITDCL